jgi:hypothetical protein
MIQVANGKEPQKFSVEGRQLLNKIKATFKWPPPTPPKEGSCRDVTLRVALNKSSLGGVREIKLK